MQTTDQNSFGNNVIVFNHFVNSDTSVNTKMRINLAADL